MGSIEGILCIDKPKGFTSFDVVARLRKITRVKRIGHAGTLDPMATGVLPVFFGRAAKAIDLLPNHDKTYEAAFKLGIVTDTQDTTGKVLSESGHNVTVSQLKEALRGFTGEQEQTPPMYSAVKVGGRRLYDIARSGGVIERKPRNINIYDIGMISSDEETGEYTIRVSCSRGTYIRTLCHDLGQKLGCGAAMSALRRTAACGFALPDCITLEDAEALAAEDKLIPRLLPVSSAFSHLPAFALDPSQAVRFRNGLELHLAQFGAVFKDGETLAVYDKTNRFLGLACADLSEEKLKIIKIFALLEEIR